jgi:hypothetical protein
LCVDRHFTLSSRLKSNGTTTMSQANAREDVSEDAHLLPGSPDDAEDYSMQFPNTRTDATLVICGIHLTYRRQDTTKLLVCCLGSVISLIFVIFIGLWYIMAETQKPPVRGVILMISDGAIG